jgi:adenosylcobinamide kinase/adenosylcobinamide-phosphate guanylyltransferase
LGDIILYLGGAKSGKTRAALAAAAAWPPPRIYLATAQALDSEMGARIAAHQAERGPEWITVEAPTDPAGALAGAPEGAPVLLDCLTLWLTNLLARQGDRLEAAPLLSEVDRLADAAARRPGPTVMVGNEVGGGLVPMEPLSRFFRDVAGLAHQRLAARAASVFLVTAGLPLRLK